MTRDREDGDGWTPTGARSSGIETADKALDLKALGDSVIALPPVTQSQTPVAAGPASFVLWIGQMADGFIPWGTSPKARDQQLRNFFPTENLLASALATVCARNAALSWKVSGDDKPAEAGQQMLNNVNNGAGWEDFIVRLSMDLYTTDTGAFVEFVRDGDSEDSPVVTLNNLDSLRCYPTGDPSFPVIYEDTLGRFHRMPWYNVVQLIEMPTAMSPVFLGAYYRLGYCAVTRILRAAQVLKSLATYNDEKLSGRFMRAIHLISGVGDTSVQDAITRAQNIADQSGQSRYIQPAIVGGVDPNAAIGHVQIDLASVPEGWSQSEMIKDYILAISMGLLTDYQEFAPLPGGGLGTATQSETLHAKARGRGPGLFQKLVVRLINQHGALPKGVEFEFDEPDLDADAQRATIALTRAQTRTADMTSGVLDAEAGRQQMLEAGDITQAIYDDLEKRAKEREAQAKQQAADQAKLAAAQPQPGSTAGTQPDTTLPGGANRSPASGPGQTTRGGEPPATGGKDYSADWDSEDARSDTPEDAAMRAIARGDRAVPVSEAGRLAAGLRAAAVTQERLDYEAQMAKRVQAGLDEAEAILRAHLLATKDNPNHDEQGRFASGPGGGAAAPTAPKPHNPAVPLAEPRTEAWTKEVAALIERGNDPTIKAADLPVLLTGMSALTSNPDITELNIEGSLLMGGEGMGIPRKDMPQVPPDQRDTFLADLKRDNGVTATAERVDPTLLKPIQKEVSGSRAGAIMQAFSTGIPDAQRILISKDNFVIDGHHTWAAAVGLRFGNVERTMPVYRLSATAIDALRLSLDWADAHGYEGQAMDAKPVAAKKALYDEFFEAWGASHEQGEFPVDVAEKDNPNHDDAGRFASGPGGGAAVAERIAKQGGITVDVHTGAEPHTGIAVGAYPDREQAVDFTGWDANGAKVIDDYIAANADKLLAGDVAQTIGAVGGVPHLGAWVHEGKVILDVTVVVPDRAAGIELGRKMGQVAVYDLASGEEIATGGAGGHALAGVKSVPAGAILVAMVPLAEMKASPEARSAFFRAVSTAVANAVSGGKAAPEPRVVGNVKEVTRTETGYLVVERPLHEGDTVPGGETA